MNLNILPLVAACGVLLGASAFAQQTVPRADGSRSATPAHKMEKRGGVRQQGASRGTPDRAAAPRDRADSTTGLGGGRGDNAFADDPSGGNREGHLRGDRGAGMMDNVRRDDQEPSE
jgi:hypothetical protein